MTEKELIGIFDSGVGGLSILKKLLPSGGHYLYFGDTKNVPYGNKTKEEIINFTRNIIEFFISKGAKRVVMACNTSSALAYDTLEKEFGTIIKIHPLIQTVAPYIAREGNIIGIMSTCATARSKTYTKEILKANDKAVVYELGCPDFVKIVEERLYDKKESVELVGFGKFETAIQKAKTGKVPGTNKTYTTKEKRVPKFRPGKGLKDLVSKK